MTPVSRTKSSACVRLVEEEAAVQRRPSKGGTKKYAHRGSLPGGGEAKQRSESNRSLPLPGDELQRLRNFSVTAKGIVNRGDSFRSAGCVCRPVVLAERPRPCRVLLVGASDVGKSAIKEQFMTSEYICASGYSQGDDEADKVVTVNLNNIESEMEFEEETLLEENCYRIRLEVDAYVVVYSVTSRRTYALARRLLADIESLVDAKAIILVANKIDLARLRTVSNDEGKALARETGCKFIETSVAINHQVDELLVGTLSQVRIKARASDKMRRKRESQATHHRPSLYSGSKASGVLKKILKRACLRSKSCDNLHVL